MAANLQRKGFQLTVFDLNETPMDILAQLGAAKTASVAEVVENADIVITMLPGSPEVEAVALGPGGILAHGQAGMLIMDMSTVDPASTDKLAAAAGEAGLSLVDAPVGRLASHADDGESLFMVGAADADYDRVRPLLEAMGTTIHHCGAPGTGIRTKLINNFLAIASCQMNAEALALASRFGLDSLQAVPPPRIEEIELRAPRMQPPAKLRDILSDDPHERARHSYGRGYRDLVRIFRREYPSPPDFVAFPRDESEVASVLDWCGSKGFAAIPFGGGSSVVGGVRSDGAVPSLLMVACSFSTGRSEPSRQ